MAPSKKTKKKRGPKNKKSSGAVQTPECRGASIG